MDRYISGPKPTPHSVQQSAPRIANTQSIKRHAQFRRRILMVGELISYCLPLPSAATTGGATAVTVPLAASSLRRSSIL